jgi:DNA polymerase III epsilon subunit-like protein
MSASAQTARSLELVRPLAFFDLETTGIDVAADQIVEIAVLKLLPDGTEETLHTLTNPGVPTQGARGYYCSRNQSGVANGYEGDS